MKKSRTLAITALTLTLFGGIGNQAQAGLLLWNPAMILLGTTGVLTSMLPYVNDYYGATHSRYHRFFPEIFMLFGAVAFLDRDLETMKTELSAEYPSIPEYIIQEALYMVRLKTEQKQFNENGLMSIELTEREFSELEKAMGTDIEPDEFAAFKKVLTTPITLKQIK
jgi:hypothetical protein